MERLFSVLTFIAVLMILISGTGVYLTSRFAVAQAKEDAARYAANGVAQTLNKQIVLLNSALDKMAKDPQIVAAFTANNPAELNLIAAKSENLVPEARKIRLLPVGTIERDESSVPRMGYGDVDMVKATFQDNPLPTIQGDTGPDRHLAMTRRVMNGNQTIGVILVSLSYDFIIQSIKDSPIKDSYMELRQEKLLLGAIGDKGGETDDLIKLAVPNTSWEIYYRDPNTSSIGQTALILSLILLPAFFALGIGYVCYRQLHVLLAQDQDWILQAFKDVLTNRPKGSYPVTLTGMNNVIAAMVRFNREVELQGLSSATKANDDFELEGYFDEIAIPPAEVKPAKALPQSVPSLDKPVVSPDSAKETTQPPEVSVTGAVPEAVTPPKPEAVKTDDFSSAIFRAYDIRGVVGVSLTKEIVYDIGRAFGSEAKELGCKTVVVGRDGRLSSPTLTEVLIQGIVSTGCHVLDIGMVPTPVLYFVVQHTDGRTGIMVTGSHNPAEYNGFKLIIKGETLSGLRIQQLKERIENKSFSTGQGSIEQNGMFVSEYIGTLCDDIQVERNLKVALDCGNGAAGELAPILLKSMGCSVIELFCDVDGNFPNHHPDPSNPENLAELIQAVKQNNADIGIAFDGDGDRLGVVDSKGKIIWPDRQMMLFAKDVLAGKPGSEVIFDVKCSRHLPDQIVKYGGRPLMWKTGHSFMKAKLKETGAKLAGEMSGHIFFNDRWFGFDDALYAAARLLQILSEDSRSSAEVFSDFPDSLSTPELNVELAEGENVKFIEKLFTAAKSTGGKVIDIDGMRIDFSDGWGLVRASNTTPSLVIRFEAENESAMKIIQDKFRKLMTDIKPDIKLPF